MAIFTLKDAIGLAQQAAKSKIAQEQFNEAILGGYMLANKDVVENEDRKVTGKHLSDSGNGNSFNNLPSGKLPNHMTFSEESPYSIGLAAAQGGKWSRSGENWMFTPSKMQLEQPGYIDKLKEYWNNVEAKRGSILNLPVKSKQPISTLN